MLHVPSFREEFVDAKVFARPDVVLLGVLLADLGVAGRLDDGKAPVEELEDKVFKLLRLATDLLLHLGQVRPVHLDAFQARHHGHLPAVVDDEVVSGEGLGQVVGVDTCAHKGKYP